MHILNYGIWCAGIIGLMSLIIITVTYRNTVKDISRLPYPKGKWMNGFYQDYYQFRSKHTEVKNPAVFIQKRMNGRRWGPISVHRMKEVVWYACVFCLACLAAKLFLASKDGLWSLQAPFANPGMIWPGIAIPVGLVVLRQILGTAFLEKRVADELLDYMENNTSKSKEVMSVLPNVKAREEGEKLVKEAVVSQEDNPLVLKPGQIPLKRRGKKVVDPIRKQSAIKQEQVVEQITKGIQETAATNNKYSHLLSKEEEDIVRDVIKEFLT